MKIASSLKSLKKRDLDSKLVRRRGRVYIINKNQNLKQDRNNLWTIIATRKHGTTLQNLYFGDGSCYYSTCPYGNLSFIK